MSKSKSETNTLKRPISDEPVGAGAVWLNADNICPYIYMRKENLFTNPGSHLKGCNWFVKKPLFKNPLHMHEVGFADQILNLETKAFQKSGMPMPRWVFYDCAVMPGFVCGFAQKTSTLSRNFREILGCNDELEWTPISLFIIIPTIRGGEWVAHNLCTTNSLVNKEDQKYALGFLTKAFGLWYANVEVLCGMTQWQNPAMRLHSHYGSFEILTAYTPVHSYARTLTYRSRVDFNSWKSFFNPNHKQVFSQFRPAGFEVDPKSDESLKNLQRRIEEKGDVASFFLNSSEIRTQDLDAPLKVYQG